MSPAAVPQAESAQGGGGWQWSEAARRGSCGDAVTTTVDHHRDQRCRTGSCTSARTIRHSGLVVVEHEFHKKLGEKTTKKLSSIRSKGSLHPAAAVFFLAKKKGGCMDPGD